MRHLECKNCGCERRIMLKGEIITQVQDQRFTQKLKTHCLNCFLRLMSRQLLPMDEQLKVDTKTLLETP